MFTGVQSRQTHLEEYAIKVLRLEKKIIELEEYAKYRISKISKLEHENKYFKSQQGGGGGMFAMKK